MPDFKKAPTVNGVTVATFTDIIADNAVVNGNFEDPDDNDGTKPAAWVYQTGTGSWALTTTSGQYSSGARALKLSSSGTSQSIQITQALPAVIPVTAGDLWYFSHQMKGSRTDAGTPYYLTVYWMDDTKTELGPVLQTFGSLATTWVKRQVAGVAPAGAFYARVNIQIYGPELATNSAVDLYLDDVVAARVLVSSTAPDESSTGEAATAGTSAFPARSDHRHRLAFASVVKWGTD